MKAELEVRLPRALVDLERVGLPAGAVEGDHQLRNERLPKRVFLDEFPQLPREFLVAAKRESRLGAPLECAEAKLLEALDLGVRRREERRVDERWSAPAPERLVGELSRARGVALLGREVCLGEQRLEAADIEVRVSEVEPVSGAATKEFGAVRLEDRPEPRDIRLHGVGGGGRRILAPDFVDQALERHDLARAEEKEGEDGSLFRSAEREQAITCLGLERSEQSKSDATSAVRLVSS
jgi:hypothetical protein